MIGNIATQNAGHAGVIFIIHPDGGYVYAIPADGLMVTMRLSIES